MHNKTSDSHKEILVCVEPSQPLAHSVIDGEAYYRCPTFLLL